MPSGNKRSHVLKQTCRKNCLQLLFIPNFFFSVKYSSLLIISKHCTKKWSFLLRISVHVMKSTFGFGHTYWRNSSWKTSFFVQWKVTTFMKSSKAVRKSFAEVYNKKANLKFLESLQDNSSVIVSFLIKLQTENLQFHYNRGYGRIIFWWISQIFQEHLFIEHLQIIFISEEAKLMNIW